MTKIHPSLVRLKTIFGWKQQSKPTIKTARVHKYCEGTEKQEKFVRPLTSKILELCRFKLLFWKIFCLKVEKIVVSASTLWIWLFLNFSKLQFVSPSTSFKSITGLHLWQFNLRIYHFTATYYRKKYPSLPKNAFQFSTKLGHAAAV